MDSGLLSTRGTVLQALIDDVHAPKLLRYVHPIYTLNDREEPTALGSSVLLRRQRQLYLATAAHVIEHNKATPGEEGSSLYVGGLRGELRLLQAEFRTNEEPADLAVAPLTGDLAEAWDLLPALDVNAQIATDETSGLHLVLGYPTRRRAFNLDRATNRVHHEAFKYAQVRHENKADGKHRFSLRMDHAHVRSGDKAQSAPSPRGVSGGGVFCLSTSEPVLAGILIEYVRGTRLVATKSSRLISFLREE